MSKKILILVEGQTEERFVKDVLSEHFFSKGIHLSPTILNTKIVKSGPNFKGGVTNFAKFKNDLMRLLTGGNHALVTTMLDYYGLPTDFPGMDTRIKFATPLERVTHVERCISKHFNNRPNFIPYLCLHEFEALLFSSADELPKAVSPSSSEGEFSKTCHNVKTPEDINEKPESAPSKRIERIFPAYRKTLHGPLAAKRIGLETLRKKCPHFDSWISRLEKVSV